MWQYRLNVWIAKLKLNKGILEEVVCLGVGKSNWRSCKWWEIISSCCACTNGHTVKHMYMKCLCNKINAIVTTCLYIRWNLTQLLRYFTMKTAILIALRIVIEETYHSVYGNYVCMTCLIHLMLKLQQCSFSEHVKRSTCQLGFECFTLFWNKCESNSLRSSATNRINTFVL